ncbi:MAG: TatD family hydrolase [Gammaproteobacteria bacterium]|nr:TatD family hydrolase [Gammaproteobacteria bacterium]
MFIDSHCHLDRINLKNFDNNFSLLIDTIRNNSVDRMLCVAINLDHYPQMLALVESYEYIDVSVGVHPSDVIKTPVDAATLIELAQNPRVVAIGETGLDYYYGEEHKTEQQAAFREHIRAANQLNKPLIIHTRDAREDTISIMTEENADQCGGVMHCFTESWEMAKQALDLGFYISFSGILTFKTADELRQVARQVPDDRFLIETDSPYLAPVPHRGKQNHPGWVQHVAECLAGVRNTSLEIIAKQSTQNYRRLFQR